MHKRVAAFLAAAMQAGVAMAAAEAPSRTATPAEQESFFDWYNATHDARGLLRPQFRVEQEMERTAKTAKRGKGSGRRVTATVDGPAQRAVLPLCRQPRAVYAYDPHGPRNARWSEAGPPQTLVWIHHQPQCGAQPDTPVRLLQPLREMDILMLLQSYRSILGSARLLMAGNTSCAPSRSRGFRLTSLDRGKDGLPVLVFESDIASEARVSVRRSRNELLPWAVACTGPRR